MNRRDPPAPSREELLTRCRRERNEMIAHTAAARATLPRMLKVAHWVRATSRLLRVIVRGVRATGD